MRYLLLSLLFFPSLSFAAVSLPWSTTYDCAEYTEGTDTLSCDGLGEWGGWTDSCGNHEQITSAANNSGGGGGRGQRHWYGPGTNSISGGLKIEFSSPPDELWIRWYMRFPAAFSWTGINYDKLIYTYLAPIVNDTEIIIEWYSNNDFRIASQGMSGADSPTAGTGWTDLFGDLTGDGVWHYFETHLKLDTDGADGIAEVWLDDTKIMNEHTVNFGGLSFGNTGFDHILIGSNQETVASSCQPIDYDDLSISTTGRIGQISGGGGSGSSVTGSGNIAPGSGSYQ